LISGIPLQPNVVLHVLEHEEVFVNDTNIEYRKIHIRERIGGEGREYRAGHMLPLIFSIQIRRLDW
jgi:hypothetical protein